MRERDLGLDADLGMVLGNALAEAACQFAEHDGQLALDDNPEHIHQARVALRRLRAHLRTFRPAFNLSWASSIRGDIGWYALLLGEARDLDVLRMRLLDGVTDLPDPERAEPLLRIAEGEVAVAREGVLSARNDPRHGRLSESLLVMGEALPLTDRALAPAAKTLPRYVGRPWRDLRERGKEAVKVPTDPHLHALRIGAKQVRYANELAARVLGSQTRLVAKRAEALQTCLGDMRDAVHLQSWLEEVAEETPYLSGFVAGQLWTAQQHLADESRARWPGLLRQLRREHRIWARKLP